MSIYSGFFSAGPSISTVTYFIMRGKKHNVINFVCLPEKNSVAWENLQCRNMGTPSLEIHPCRCTKSCFWRAQWISALLCRSPAAVGWYLAFYHRKCFLQVYYLSCMWNLRNENTKSDSLDPFCKVFCGSLSLPPLPVSSGNFLPPLRPSSAHLNLKG